MESNCLSRVAAGYGLTNLGIGAETNGKKGTFRWAQTYRRTGTTVMPTGAKAIKANLMC